MRKATEIRYDGLIARALRPVDELASIASESARLGPGTRGESRGVAHAAVAAFTMLHAQGKFLEENGATREDVRRSDLYTEAAGYLPAVAAAALLGSGQYGADILEETGLTPAAFNEAASWLSRLVLETYGTQNGGDHV